MVKTIPPVGYTVQATHGEPVRFIVRKGERLIGYARRRAVALEFAWTHALVTFQVLQEYEREERR